mgnify:CR=1 FL=1
MASGAHIVTRAPLVITVLILLLIGQSLSPLAFSANNPPNSVSGRDGEVWIDGGVAWPQFGRTPGHESIVPAHDPSEPATGELLSITNPVLNWMHYSSADTGVETLGVSVGNFSANIDTGGLVLDSCARDSLSPVFVHQQDVGGNPHAFMRIVDGDSSQTMWQVDVGAIDLEVKATNIKMTLDVAKLTGDLNIEKFVSLKTRQARPDDCICSNESAYYPPLANLNGSVPGVTIEGEVTARSLGCL